MPFFHRTSRIPKVDDTILIGDSTAHRNDAYTQTHQADLVRPHTSGGASRRYPGDEISSLANVQRRLSMVMSRSTTALPLTTTTTPARHIPRASQSTTVLPIHTSMSIPRRDDVGLAIGSPSELQNQSQRVILVDSRSDTPESIHKQIRADTEPYQAVNRPQLKRWKTVSGLFARRKTFTPTSTPLISVSESPSQSSNKHTGRGSLSRANSYFHRKSRESTPYQTPDLRFDDRSTMLTPTPGHARAVEAGDDPHKPNLDIDIPTGSLDRYSVMFSNLFSSDSFQGHTERFSDVEAAFEPPSSKAERERVQDRLHITAEPLYPVRTQSLLAPGSTVRDSAVPAALFSSPRREPSPAGATAPAKATLFSRGSLHHLHHLDEIEEREILPEDIEAWALGVSPQDLVQRRHSHRESIDSFSTSAVPSPALTSSTWCSESTIGERRHSLVLPIMRHDDKQRSAHIENLLSVPSPTKRTSWGSSAYSPTFTPSSASPRLKFGYDEPHSPNVCVATSVQVTFRSGQCYKPQLVSRDTDHSRQASCSGLLA